MLAKCDEQVKAEAGNACEQCGAAARSPFVIIAVYLTIIVSAVLLGIGVVELWRWAK